MNKTISILLLTIFSTHFLNAARTKAIELKRYRAAREKHAKALGIKKTSLAKQIATACTPARSGNILDKLKKSKNFPTSKFEKVAFTAALFLMGKKELRFKASNPDALGGMYKNQTDPFFTGSTRISAEWKRRSSPSLSVSLSECPVGFPSSRKTLNEGVPVTLQVTVGKRKFIQKLLLDLPEYLEFIKGSQVNDEKGWQPS